MRYKLKQTYYGSPEEGTIVELTETVRDNMPYYECNGRSFTTDEVENYPHLWEKLEDEYPTINQTDWTDQKYLFVISQLTILLKLRDMWWAKDNWKPDWMNRELKWHVYFHENKLIIDSWYKSQRLFIFKDKATAEKFLEQNRDYLEQLKPLYNGL